MNIKMFGEPEEPDGDGSATNGEDERVGVDDRDAALVVIAATAGGCGKPAVQFFLDIFPKFQQSLNVYQYLCWRPSRSSCSSIS